ncbi:hypothetical protein LXL04_021128 [Taraxacum kok-saghyz]
MNLTKKYESEDKINRFDKDSISFENSYIPENPRTPKPLTFSKNRLRGAKNRSNKSPVAKKNFRKNDFFFSKNFAYVQTFILCICAQSLYNTYLKRFVKKNVKKNAKKKKLHICTKNKKKLHICKRFRSRFFERNNGLGDIGNWGSMINFPQVVHGSCRHDDDCDFIQPPCPGDTYGYDQVRPSSSPTNEHMKLDVVKDNPIPVVVVIEEWIGEMVENSGWWETIERGGEWFKVAMDDSGNGVHGCGRGNGGSGMTNFPQVVYGCRHDDDCDFIQPPCPGDTYGNPCASVSSSSIYAPSGGSASTQMNFRLKNPCDVWILLPGDCVLTVFFNCFECKMANEKSNDVVLCEEILGFWIMGYELRYSPGDDCLHFYGTNHVFDALRVTT